MEVITIGILVVVALCCAWVLFMVRKFVQAAKEDDLMDVEFEDETQNKPEDKPITDDKIEWIKERAHSSAMNTVMRRPNHERCVWNQIVCTDAEWALFQQIYEERKRELTTITEGKTVWLLTDTASYGTEVIVTGINTKPSEGYSVFCRSSNSRRYWVRPDQLSPFSPRELYLKHTFNAIVYWPDTPYHGRKVSIRDYNEDYLYTDCGLMLTHAMIRFPRSKFPEMTVPETTPSTPTNTNEQES